MGHLRKVQGLLDLCVILSQRDIVGLQNFQLLTLTLGKVNKDADTLSRIPLDINQYMPACTQESSQEVISATLSGINELQNGEDVSSHSSGQAF